MPEQHTFHFKTSEGGAMKDTISTDETQFACIFASLALLLRFKKEKTRSYHLRYAPEI